MVKNLPANAGDVRDAGSVPGWGRSLEEGMTAHSGILAWRISRTEEPGGLQSMGSQRSTLAQARCSIYKCAVVGSARLLFMGLVCSYLCYNKQ